MSGSSVQILAQAHAYIEAGNLEDAENLIRSLLEQDPENTDAWWLLAHSVRDARAAREALDEVLRLDPNDQQARSLLSALDDRFPADLASDSGRRWQLSHPRLSRPRMPSFHFPGGYDDYSTPVSYLVLVVLLIAGGWLMLRYFGIELNLTTPATTEPELAQAVDSTAAALADLTGSPVAGDGIASTTGTAVASTGTQIVGSLTEDSLDAPAIATGSGIRESDANVSPAPISPAPALPDPDSGAAGETATGDPALATPVPLPTVSPVPAPTYPFPIQTDPEEFAALYLATYVEAGLQLAAIEPLLEGSQFGSVALAGVCLQDTFGLRNTVNEAMEVMASFASQLLNSAPALGVKVLDCENDGEVLRIVAAPVQEALAWGEGSLSLPEFQASWEAVG